MGNVGVSIKRFLGNKNTVTIIGVILGIVVMYLGYNWRVKQAVEPQSVPFAKVEINGNTLITKEQVGTIKVSKAFVDQSSGLVTSINQVIGKYVSYDTKIPEGGLFYNSQLMAAEQRPNYITEGVEPGYTLFSLPVDLHKTYANAIMPDDYIDLYMSAMSDSGKVIVAKLIESIKVKDVRDSKGIPVFSSQSTTKIPAELIFVVPNDMYNLLKRASDIRTNSIEIYPVLRGREYTENPSATQVASRELIDLINSKSDLSYDTD